MRRDFMTKEAVVAEMKSGSRLAQARTVFSSAWAEIDTAMRQRVPLSIIEIRNMEFDAVMKVAAILGVDLEPSQGNAEAPPSENP
ncbi:hypothetical protein [Rhizobium sp. BK176]|uniref:hypothetical protein n=1 Tax=Rhizobium sp. BK176 TaxID=2587071 RepID=UPI00216767CF|nr:hypothetical protein [Rhizobium sp. BK176]MCS4088762.1 ppGpp synthetase/RelA/SpoT-type nucleotidyltransferase [Rhizobium sp. BK176]